MDHYAALGHAQGTDIAAHKAGDKHENAKRNCTTAGQALKLLGHSVATSNFLVRKLLWELVRGFFPVGRPRRRQTNS